MFPVIELPRNHPSSGVTRQCGNTMERLQFTAAGHQLAALQRCCSPKQKLNILHNILHFAFIPSTVCEIVK